MPKRKSCPVLHVRRLIGPANQGYSFDQERNRPSAMTVNGKSDQRLRLAALAVVMRNAAKTFGVIIVFDYRLLNLIQMSFISVYLSFCCSVGMGVIQIMID